MQILGRRTPLQMLLMSPSKIDLQCQDSGPFIDEAKQARPGFSEYLELGRP
jgi:hypothetical protein